MLEPASGARQIPTWVSAYINDTIPHISIPLFHTALVLLTSVNMLHVVSYTPRLVPFRSHQSCCRPAGRG